MKTITHLNGVKQSKEDFLLQELTGLILRIKLSTSKDIDEIRFQRDRIAMLESIVDDYYRGALTWV